MGRKISISQLSAAVMEELEGYADLAAEDMKSAVKKAAATVRKDIEASAPRNTGDYAKSWAMKTTKESSNYQVYQPVCQKYPGLSEVYSGTEGEEHPGFL